MDESNAIEDKDVISEDKFHELVSENASFQESYKNAANYEYPEADPSKEVELIVKVNRSHYAPKEKCIGFVKVVIHHLHKISDILIKLNQAEYSKIADDEFNHNTTVAETTIKMKEFFKKDTITLDVGSFLFPFYFDIPENAFPYFNYADVAITSSLSTEVVASLKDEPNFSGKLAVKIKSLLPDKKEEPLKVEGSKTMKKWLLFDAGTISLKLEINKDRYKTGDDCQAKYHIDNSKGSININKVKVSLYRKIIFRDQFGVDIVTRLQKIYGVSDDVKCPPTERVDGECYLGMDDSFMFYKDIKMKPKTHDLQPTMTSKLFTCEYFIRMTAKSDTVLTKDNKPRVATPVTIYV